MTFSINNNNRNENTNKNIQDVDNRNEENIIILLNNDSHPYRPLFTAELLTKIFQYAAGTDDREFLRNFCSFRHVCQFWHNAADYALLRQPWKAVTTFVFKNSFFKADLAKIGAASMENKEASLESFKTLSDTVNQCAGINSNHSMRILPSDYQKLDTDLRKEALRAALKTLWGKISEVLYLRGQQIRFGFNESGPSTPEEIQSWLNNPQNAASLNLIRHLDLSDCNLKVLPPEIEKLQQLQGLYLFNNQLTTLPNEIGNLQQLKRLELPGNLFNTLPDSIGNLVNLEILNLSQNLLTTLPDAIGNLKKLNWLNLSNNRLTALPNAITDLNQLDKLNLSNNQFTTFPDTINNLSELQELDLSNNQLTTLPNEFGNLNELGTLNLSNNQLATLPDEIGNLNELGTLNLSNNQLTTLPNEFGNLNTLRTLNLSNNQLTTLPNEFGNLKELMTLNLCNNQLTALPNAFNNLKQLVDLELSENLLTTLPNDISDLNKLRRLKLSNNQLTTLPNELGICKNLEFLDVSNNHLITLPETIGNLEMLRFMNTKGNPLIFILDKRDETNHNKINQKSTAKEHLLKHLNDFTQYSPRSKIGKFFKAIANNELKGLEDSFEDLDACVKQKIHKVFQEKAGVLCRHVTLYDDRKLLLRSAHKAIRDLYESLDEKQKGLVHWHVWNLAKEPNDGDHNWGGTHLFDHLLRFSDALETVMH